MSEIGGLDSLAPDEAGGGVSESLSEEVRQRFASSAAKSQQARKQEKKSKKRDQKVVQTIKKFFDKKGNGQLIVLISRLSARNCPSIFILAVLSLIDEDCCNTVEEYLAETTHSSSHDLIDNNAALTSGGALSDEMNKQMIEWILRLQMVLSLDPENTLMRLMVDANNVDGTVLQLTTITLVNFFKQHGRNAPYEKLQPLTASILQTVFEPFIGSVRKKLLEREAEEKDDDDE